LLWALNVADATAAAANSIVEPMALTLSQLKFALNSQ